MPSEIEIEYNLSLQLLEDLLSKVSKPGEFFMEGSREVPMPTITVNGVGVLSFPIPEIQVKAMIREASLAPYGRGEDTILDTSVRKTWQISPDHIQIGGKSWQMNFDAILDEIKTALGCLDVTVSAELYKLLIYDEGGFFLPHRDSEKSPGMFGTMIIALPSSHEGGQLVVRHKDNKAIIDLSGAEGSELKFGAFYADCEHEVLPVTKGYRICLVYNLIQKFSGENRNKTDTFDSLKAPCYINEIQEASNILKTAFTDNDDQPSKLVWLLEHQYSTAELSFNSLKNTDAAIAKVLTKAAEQARCALYLGIVHIEESGSAEADFGYYSSRSRRGYYRDDEMDVESDDYEIVDICDSERYIDGWMDPQNRLKDFGRVPIEEGELLPSHALDGVEPDEQRLLEATGNAGVSFERAYHRAALILWPQENYINVLLQSGIKSGVSYFKEKMNLGLDKKNQSEWQVDMKKIALAIIGEFEDSVQSPYSSRSEGSISAEMLTLLCQLQENSLVERFIHVIIASYDGSENDALIAAVDVLKEPSMIDRLFSDLFQKNIPQKPVQCINLYKKLISVFCKNPVSSVKDVLKTSSEEVVNGLKFLNQKPTDAHQNWKWRKKTEIDSEAVALLWHALEELNAKKLQDEVISIFIANRDTFDPRTILAPALAKLRIILGSPLLHLWEHVSNCLLTGSEYPPNPPTNWAQEVKIVCSCDDCKNLKIFAKDPNIQIYRFQMPQQRRDHIANQLRQNGLDMSMTTDESRRPYTLICTKTRQRYQEKCNEYRADVKAMQLLIPLLPDLSKNGENAIMKLRNRLIEAVDRLK
jgi:2OG-Fe(II) oxygenase superfamily